VRNQAGVRLRQLKFLGFSGPFSKKASIAAVLLLAMASSSTFAPSVAQADPSAVDPGVAEAMAKARQASSSGGLTHSVEVYTALRQLWKRWDQTNPAEVEAALATLEEDRTLSAPHRAYAGLLSAYARRRRGDIDGAAQKLHALGYVDRWVIAGPFDNEGKSSLFRAFGPELDATAPVVVGQTFEGKERPVTYRAVTASSGTGALDLTNLIRPFEKTCSFATVAVRDKKNAQASKSAAGGRMASLWIGSSGSFLAYWNGQESLLDVAYRSLEPERWSTQVRLSPGWNRLLVKVCGDDAGSLLQVRIGDASGAPDPSIELSTEASALQEAAELAKTLSTSTEGKRAGSATKRAAASKAAKGITVVEGGDEAPRKLPIPTGGALAGLNQAINKKALDAPLFEAYARYLMLTDSDDPSTHTARDFAYRAAEGAPNVERFLLAGDLAEDRNARRAWVARARLHVKTDEEDVAVALAEANLARSGTNWREAVPFYDRVLVKDPGCLPAILGRVDLYNDAGLRQSALVLLEAAAKQKPHAVALLQALSRQLRGVGRTTEAEEVEARYAQRRADDPTYLRDRIDLAIARRDVAMGTRLIERVLALNPDSWGGVDLAARSFRQLGETPRALALLKHRLEVVPEDVEAMRALADLHGEDGRKEDQLRLLRQVLALRPQAKDVREYIESASPPRAREDEAYALSVEELQKLGKEPRPKGYARRILRDLEVTTAFPNGLASHFHQIAFQPLSDDGAAAARQYAFSFQADREVVDLRSARVFRENGTVDEAVDTGIGPADNPGLAMYTSARTFYVQLPRLSPGDVVELRYRVEDVTPRNEFGDGFSQTTYLQSFFPTSSVEAVLLAPSSKKLTVKGPSFPGFSLDQKTEGERQIIRLVGKDIPGLVAEPAMPPLAEVAPHLSVTTFGSWDEVGKWFWGLAKDQLDADDEVRRLAKELTKDATSERDKVKAIYGYVVQKTRYVALEFGIEGFKPRRCAQTIARGWGDCKDKATVIVTMLRELGIPAELVLVRTGQRGLTATDTPSWSMFDHAIAYVPSLDLYLDGTAEYTGMTELPGMDRGAIALRVAEGGKATLVNLPTPPASETGRSRQINLTVSDRGTTDVELRVETRGAIAAEWRQRYHAASTQRARLTEDLGGELGGVNPAPGTQGLEVSDLENIEQPVKVRLKGQALGLSQREGDGFSVAVAPNLRLSQRLASLSTRTHPVRMPFAASYDDEWNIKLPAGYTVRHAPESRKISSPFGTLDLEVDSSQSSKVVVKVKIALTKTRIEPGEYAAFRTFCEDVDKTLGDRLTLSK
jgi:cellulose synthase operon protein C